MARKLAYILLTTGMLPHSVPAAPPLEPRGSKHSKPDWMLATKCSAAREADDSVRYTVWIARPLQQCHCRTARGTMSAAGWQFFIKECVPRTEDKSLDVVFKARKHTTDARNINTALQSVWQGSHFECAPPLSKPRVPKLVLTPSELGEGGRESMPVINDGLLSPKWQPRLEETDGVPERKGAVDDTPQESNATLPSLSPQTGGNGHGSGRGFAVSQRL
ncbi:hypothetical protein DOTSEDRAFT_37235 [Dothistroma septosporum NZE10]|uniref:Uncharacterized protein n=1 Tax=Dothistroma septosporum (strain NZE10 / CBS 128990) TaxID=675120 RepID=N1PH43_DOTSN|nr:hypothetical protein DOTSEDRAFT_37235 [Dothistroma septosporum NZE10]